MAAPVEIPGLAPGTVLFDKYEILGVLGAGGMSLVLRAKHIKLGTTVALKFLLPELAALPDAPERFMREAQAASRIKSEHVVRVTDIGTLPGGPPYMEMELLEGRDLGRLVKQGTRFPVKEAIEYVVQAADALARAHSLGIVHRDVKPSNLFLVEREGSPPLVKVLDFGISKIIEEAAKQNLELTKTNAMMGSALYMSLEQMRDARKVDHRTDIYALGVSLYELLTGSHPFTADTFLQLSVKVSLDPPDPLRDHRPDVPEELADAIAVAYARHAVDRYPTIGSFMAALAPFATPETQATIKALVEWEHSNSHSSVPMIRMLTPLAMPAVKVRRPSRIQWPVIAAAAAVALALASVAAVWAARNREIAMIDAGALSASSSIPSVPESVPAVPSPPTPPVPSSATPPVPSSAAPELSSSAPVKPPRTGPPECRRGERFYADKNGMRRECPH